jgi:uncharacterized protein (TIGR03437 family)
MTRRGAALVLCGAAAIALAPSWLRAQTPPKPVVSPGGIVNAASLAPPSQPGYGISQGSIVSIFGTNLAAAEASAPSVPLPKRLAGTTVTFDGISAPLFYVSPGQINAQVPNASSINPVVLVTTVGGSSDPVQVGGNGSLGLFTTGAAGCGRGAILNLAPDGTLSLNTPQNSAAPGGYIAVFGTGLPGTFLNPAPPPDGDPATSNPLIWYRGGVPVAYLRDQYLGLQVPFAGRAPTLVGVDQYNVQLGPGVLQGCQLPLRVVDWTSSQPVLVSIHEGGGACVPNVQGAGVLRWEKVVSSDTGGTTTAETFFVDLSAGEGKGPPQLLTPQPDVDRGLPPLPPQGPRCADAEDRTLDAGLLVAYGPGGAGLRVSPTLSDGKLLYTQALPPGTVGPGTYGVVALGGQDVGPFATSVAIPAPIQLTTALPPGSSIPDDQNFVVTWTGGNPEDVVSVRLLSVQQGVYGQGGEVVASAADGKAVMPVYGGSINHGGASLPGVPSGPVEVVVTHTASAAAATTFQATGLTLGGWHEWMYRFRFSGLTVQ